MAEDITTPSPEIVLDLIESFRRSKTMFAAVSIGVFDAVSERAKTLAELAGELQCSQDGLERLLNACVCLNLLSVHDEQYANTPVAREYLTSSSPRRMTGYINYSNSVAWKLWGNLEDAVREGTHRWKQCYGWDGPLFSHFFKTDQDKREFLMGMNGFGVVASPQVVSAFDLSRFSTLVDLGGATGHLAIAACERYPTLRGILYDLPDVIGLAREIIGQSVVANRVQVVSGDFFTDDLPPGDLYVLGRIIHDWTVQKIDQLVAKIYASLPRGGGLLIAEKILLDDKSGPRWAVMQNLNMLTCTEGKERTLNEYETLLKRVGFGTVTGCRTAGSSDAILALKD